MGVELQGERRVDWIPQVFASSAAVMAGSSEKVPIASAGPEDVHQFMPPVSAHRAPSPHTLKAQGPNQ